MKRICLTILLVTTTLCSTSSWAIDTSSSECSRWIADSSQQYHKPAKLFREWLQKAHFNPDVITKIDHPAEALGWDRYQKIFITDKRINKGVHYWKDHEDSINAISKAYHVSPAMMVSLLGIESNYRPIHTSFNALDSLTTLSFDHPHRAKFFQSELAALIVWADQNHIDPREVPSSYAGAIGMPQFMPSNLLKYTVQWHGMESPQVIDQPEEAMASMANYLHHFNYDDNCKLKMKLIPGKTKDKAIIKGECWRDKPVTVRLENNQTQQYQVSRNFDTIKRYNTSDLYGLAAIQLAEYLQAQHDHDQK